MPVETGAARGTRGRACALVVACAVVAAAPASANTGLNFIGFGVESVGMGGADTAVARDTTALNTNPAGLSQLAGPRFDGFGAAAFALDIGHSDALGNDRRISNEIAASAGFGFAAPLGNTPLVAGLGLFAQGGAGNVYKNLQTPFGTVDELSALFAFARVSPGLAWRASETLTFGVAVPVTAIKAQQWAFPNTSVFVPGNPANSFFGLKLRDAVGVRASGRVGALWRPTPSWSFGAVLAPKIAIDADNGNADVNLAALGLGTVHYSRARVAGLALPQELAVGASFQATPALLVSLKLAHLAWSDALRSLTVSVSEPNDPRAPSSLAQTSRIDWKDQVVTALGVAYAFADRRLAYGGVSYAPSPAPPETLTPLLAAISRWHLTGGFSMPIGREYQLGFAVEYTPNEQVSYTNPDSPLGQGAAERLSYVALHFMLSRRW